MNDSYPNIAAFSNQFLELCKQQGIYKQESGKIILRQIESFLDGNEIADKDFQEAIDRWKHGNFCYGYYVNNNDTEFVNYIKTKISHRHI